MLWVLFFVGFGMSSAGHEMYEACHDELSVVSLLIGDWMNLAITLMNSLWRCRHLEARDRHQEMVSWASYRVSVMYRAKSVWNKRLVDSVCGAGPALILLSIICNKKFGEVSFRYVCRHGSYEAFSYGLIQYSKILVGTSAVGVYSFLVIILFVSVCLLYITRLLVYEVQYFSKLVPHVLLSYCRACSCRSSGTFIRNCLIWHC